MEQDYQEGQRVEVTIKRFSKLGAFASIEGGGWGLIYQDDIYKKLSVGDKVTATIKTIREDGKIDLSLRNPGYKQNIDPNSQLIISKLKNKNGFLRFNDKSEPEAIKREFQMSKKQFKHAIGRLYKERKILITNEGIELVEEQS